jgi:hypothetical protein
VFQQLEALRRLHLSAVDDQDSNKRVGRETATLQPEVAAKP